MAPTSTNRVSSEGVARSLAIFTRSSSPLEEWRQGGVTLSGRCALAVAGGTKQR